MSEEYHFSLASISFLQMQHYLPVTTILLFPRQMFKWLPPIQAFTYWPLNEKYTTILATKQTVSIILYNLYYSPSLNNFLLYERNIHKFSLFSLMCMNGWHDRLFTLMSVSKFIESTLIYALKKNNVKHLPQQILMLSIC